MTLLVAGIALDMAQVLGRPVLVLLCYLGGIDPGGWMTPIASPTTSLVFLEGLGLRLISRRRGLELSLVLGSLIAGLSIGVLLVFFG